jgi:flagellin
MGFRVNTNVGALKAYYELAKVNSQTEKAQLRLSSGKRIQNVADDTSGFNVGSALERKISTMSAALGNIGSAKDMLATAEGALLGISNLLTKIEGKMADAQDPAKDRSAIASDINALANEIDNILKSTRFNETNLLSGAGAAGAGTKAQNFVFQIGANSNETLQINFATGVASNGGYDAAFSASLSNFTLANAGSIASDTSTALQNNLATLKSAISTALGSIGNFVQRLDVKEDFLNTAIANAKSSTSRIFDTDFAMESLNAMRGQILSQSATSMLAQLNAAPQNVLALFR